MTALFLLVFVAAYFLLKVFVSISLYVSPLLLIGFRRAALAGPTPPLLSTPVGRDDIQATDRVRGLLLQLRQSQTAREDWYARAVQHGVSLTANSNHTRFDGRSGIGKEANRAIDQSEAVTRGLVPEISAARKRVWAGLADWRLPFDRWASARSAGVALSVAVVIALIVGLWLRDDPGISWIQTAFVIGPLRGISSAIVKAILAGEVVYFTLHAIWKRRLETKLFDQESTAGWLWLTKKWNPALNVEDHLFHVQSRYDEGANSGQGDHESQETAQPEAEWPEVLGVARDVSIDELHAAYRRAMKSYHSDLVATLGPKLREVAEEETKRINLAYENARRERGVH